MKSTFTTPKKIIGSDKYYIENDHIYHTWDEYNSEVITIEHVFEGGNEVRQHRTTPVVSRIERLS